MTLRSPGQWSHMVLILARVVSPDWLLLIRVVSPGADSGEDWSSEEGAHGLVHERVSLDEVHRLGGQVSRVVDALAGRRLRHLPGHRGM